MKVKVKLDNGAYLPERAHDTDAGADIRTPEKVELRDELSKWERLTAGIDLPEHPVTQFKPKDLGRETCHRALDFDGTRYVCSACGENFGPSRWHFCPNCGRKVVE